MAVPTLDTIRIKVRRLTRSLSPAQLTDAQIDDYINTFVLYDFPEHLRLFNLRKTFEFFTEPYVDVYKTDYVNPASPLYQFKEKYTTVHPPVYIAGYQTLFVESREKFYGIYPMLNSIASIGATGTGAQLAFPGTVANVVNGTILLRNNVLFDSIDVNGNGLSMIDYPINATYGNLYIPGGAPTSTTALDVNNNINYTTGQYIVTFATAPANGATINSQIVLLQTAIPKAVLFYDGQFTVRPVPDQPYRINMEVYVRPTEFLSSTPNQQVDLQEWWQYIAYGAAKKVFEDRMDMESVQMIMPEFKKQELLIQRRTIVQYTSQRAATIYTEDNNQTGTYGPSSGGTF
jgi:hypothetical protein